MRSTARSKSQASRSPSDGAASRADLTGLKIQDDPALSDRPFVEANDAYAKVDLSLCFPVMFTLPT